jgi:hypothetical protein
VDRKVCGLHRFFEVLVVYAARTCEGSARDWTLEKGSTDYTDYTDFLVVCCVRCGLARDRRGIGQRVKRSLIYADERGFFELLVVCAGGLTGY